MATCIKCNQSIPDGSKFCNFCGEKQELTCPSCGAVLPENSKFCNLCGTNVQEEVAKAAPAPSAEPERDEQPKVVKSVKNVSGLYTNGHLKSISTRAAVFAYQDMLWRVDEDMQYRSWDASCAHHNSLSGQANAEICALTQTEDSILVAVDFKNEKKIYLIRLSETLDVLEVYPLEDYITTCRLTDRRCYQFSVKDKKLDIIQTFVESKHIYRWHLDYHDNFLGDVWVDETQVYYNDLENTKCFDAQKGTIKHLAKKVQFIDFDDLLDGTVYYTKGMITCQNQPFNHDKIYGMSKYKLNTNTRTALFWGYHTVPATGYFDGSISFCHPMINDLFMIDNDGNVSKNWRTGPEWCGMADLAIIWKNYLIADLTTEDRDYDNHYKKPHFIAYPVQFEKPSHGCITLKKTN